VTRHCTAVASTWPRVSTRPSCTQVSSGPTFSKVPRNILGGFHILGEKANSENVLGEDLRKISGKALNLIGEINL